LLTSNEAKGPKRSFLHYCTSLALLKHDLMAGRYTFSPIGPSARLNGGSYTPSPNGG